MAAEVDEPEMTFLCAEDSVMLEKLHKKVRVIKEISLPINLHDFFATFVDDGAPHSYQRYVEHGTRGNGGIFLVLIACVDACWFVRVS